MKNVKMNNEKINLNLNPNIKCETEGKTIKN
jgi:hypothetical protein